MKKIALLIFALLLVGCGENISSDSQVNSSNPTSVIDSSSTTTDNPTSTDPSSNVTSSGGSTSEGPTSVTDSTSNGPTSSGPVSSTPTSPSDNPSIEDSTSEEVNVCSDSYRPGGYNEDGSVKLPIPCNKNNKVQIGSDNASMTSFSFVSSMPDYFRYIYGNNFTNGQFYADPYGGGLKISSSTSAKQGFQTAMFTTNLKLEIRIEIGKLANSNDGNKIDKDKPVLAIYAFDENGTYLRKAEVEELDKGNENKSLTRYIDGNNVAYLELRAIQLPYKGSQAYNLQILGLSLIAWPYAL